MYRVHFIFCWLFICCMAAHAQCVLKGKVLDGNRVGVEVKASSYIRQKDRVLIIPDKQQVRHAGTGYDLLYNLMIPGITVDRRKGTVSSTIGEATLYINGRKAEFREIQSLRPRDIEKVEYFDMPTGNMPETNCLSTMWSKNENREVMCHWMLHRT